jgi:hypothetical protein
MRVRRFVPEDNLSTDKTNAQLNWLRCTQNERKKIDKTRMRIMNNTYFFIFFWKQSSVLITWFMVSNNRNNNNLL